ncbi:MAG: SDR family NAD(P)-dependent oxidoreductase [Sneathiellaceae bacterium]
MADGDGGGSVAVIGAGSGLSASVARLFAQAGHRVALGARDPGKLADLCAGTGARAWPCDATDGAAVDAFFDSVAAEMGVPEVVVFNPSARARGPVAELDREAVRHSLMVSCYAGFLVGQRAARDMLAAGRGSILFTGASASVKGYAQSAPFAMGKFGLRGLAQSMARELAPRNIHVAHFVIDGGIGRPDPDPREGRGGPDSQLDPDAIAQAYLFAHRQPRSAWTWEFELRPWVESF